VAASQFEQVIYANTQANHFHPYNLNQYSQHNTIPSGFDQNLFSDFLNNISQLDDAGLPGHDAGLALNNQSSLSVGYSG
jgi:hypothetical protein